MKIHLLGTVFLALVASGGSAMAANWPTSVVGTWNALADQSNLTLDITSQATANACKAIAGTLGTDNISGYYCPSSGRFSFLRANAGNNVTFQVYTGNLSHIGTTDYMTGVFEQETTVGSAVEGEYSFFASK